MTAHFEPSTDKTSRSKAVIPETENLFSGRKEIPSYAESVNQSGKKPSELSQLSHKIWRSISNQGQIDELNQIQDLDLDQTTREKIAAELHVKNRNKVIRTIIESVILLAGVYAILRSMVLYPHYKPYVAEFAAAAESGVDNGFITISYFGVERFDNSDDSLISQEMLRKHLTALKENGYVTITQQDILNYYEKGTPLPDRALFLIFEDGRRDTVIFAQPILEDLNYHATALTYADRFDRVDTKFLKPDDLASIQKSGFWDTGTNGYRLEYINVYDRYNNFFGHLTTDQFRLVSKYLNRDYNHYLMDYIRDKDTVPTETKEQMRTRIDADYELMYKLYTEQTGSMPDLYILMHSNTGQYGTNDYASEENEKEIKKYFKMNFNREKDCLNTREDSIYDLTRTQPQSFWNVNHLLMKVQQDTGQTMVFEPGKGNLRTHTAWLLQGSGAQEISDNQLILTSPPGEAASMQLSDLLLDDFTMDVTLKGNIIGTQEMILQNNIVVSLTSEKLTITAGGYEIISVDMWELDQKWDHSIRQDQIYSQMAYQTGVSQYSEDATLQNRAVVELPLLAQRAQMAAESTEGEEMYRPDYDLQDAGSLHLHIVMKGSNLSVTADGHDIVRNLQVPRAKSTLVFRASPDLQFYSQRNLQDNIYDGIMQDLVITIPSEQKPILDYRIQPPEYFFKMIRNGFSKVVQWFILNL